MEVTDWTNWNEKDERNKKGLVDIYLDIPADEKLISDIYKAIIEDIRAYDYHFTGDFHQYGNCGVPVVDNKYVVQLTQRSWGQLMADAYPDEDYSSYEEKAINQGLEKKYYNYLKWAWTVPQGEQQRTPESQCEAWDDFDWCYECTGYGDDYSVNENGDLVSNCDGCPHNRYHHED